MKPMLAFKFNDHKHNLTWPAHCQPKLDGIRAIYKNGNFYSRDGHMWQPRVVNDKLLVMRQLPQDVVYDGEFYVHGWRLQEINSAVAVTRKEPASTSFSISYHVFDCFFPENPMMPFEDRTHWLFTQFVQLELEPKVKFVPTYSVDSISQFEDLYANFRSQNYEGAMWRDSLAPYGTESRCKNKENRWKVLLKRKDWLDDWFDCLDFDYGQGRLENFVGALVCKTKQGKEFRVGSGLNDQLRHDFIGQPPRSVKLQFETYSADGIPLKPVFLEYK